MTPSTFLDAIKGNPIFNAIGELYLVKNDGKLLLVDDPVCYNCMFSENSPEFQIVKTMRRLGIDDPDGLIATGEARIFGFVAQVTVNLNSLLVDIQVPLVDIAITQSQLTTIFGVNEGGTEVLVCDISGRKNVTVLRHGDKTHFLDVSLVQFGFPCFDFLENPEELTLKPGEGFFFTVSCSE